jgi:hypothetical protein
MILFAISRSGHGPGIRSAPLGLVACVEVREEPPVGLGDHLDAEILGALGRAFGRTPGSLELLEHFRQGSRQAVGMVRWYRATAPDLALDLARAEIAIVRK